jgi:hypothetical protein
VTPAASCSTRVLVQRLFVLAFVGSWYVIELVLTFLVLAYRFCHNGGVIRAYAPPEDLVVVDSMVEYIAEDIVDIYALNYETFLLYVSTDSR